MSGADASLEAGTAERMVPARPAPSPEDLGSRLLLRPALLLLLSDHEGHGYELMGRLGELGAEVPPTTGALYRSLRVMADEGLVRSYWHTSERGPARRVYAITPLGKQHLDQLIAGLSSLLRTVQHILDRYRVPGELGRAPTQAAR